MSHLLVTMGLYVGVFLPGVLWLGRKRYLAKSVEQIAREDAEQAEALRRQAHPAIVANFTERLRG